MAQAAHALHERLVVANDGTALAAARDDLVLPEAEAAGRADRADLAALVERTGGLRSVLDDGHAAGGRHLQERVHVGRVTVEVHGNDRLRAFGQALGGALG